MTLMPKGAGSENQTVMQMMSPADGVDGLINFILKTVEERAAKACPPVELGIGIGGDAALVVLLAKKALAGIDLSKNPIDRALADKILREANKLKIGPMGFGGETTVSAVHICSAPCHIASMPVALIFQCHAARHYTVIL